MHHAVSRRLEWVDLLRGAACFLVVFNHAAGFSPMFGVPIGGAWLHLIRVFDAFRMPVFFFVAGLLSSSTLSATWHEVLRRRVLTLAWVYLVWCLLHAAVLTVCFGTVDPDAWRQAAFALVWPHQNLWFLFALAVYLVVARAIRTLPAWVQVGLALYSALLASSGVAFVSTSNPAVGKTAEYFLAFIVAVHLRPVILRPGPVHPLRAAVLAIAFVAVAEIEIRTGSAAVFGVPVLTGALAVAAAVSVARVVGGWRVMAPWRALGRRTLPVYCVHFLPAIVIPSVFAQSVNSSAVLQIWPMLATILALGIALAVHAATRRVPGLWAFPFAARSSARRGAIEPDAQEDDPRKDLATDAVAAGPHTVA